MDCLAASNLEQSLEYFLFFYYDQHDEAFRSWARMTSTWILTSTIDVDWIITQTIDSVDKAKLPFAYIIYI